MCEMDPCISVMLSIVCGVSSMSCYRGVCLCVNYYPVDLIIVKCIVNFESN